MKKNVLFAIPVVVIAALLFALRVTGLPAHIGVSVVGLAVLVAYALATKNAWKCPALEIIARVLYGIALISGIVVMNVHGVAAIALVHRISAALFVLVFLVTEIHKAIKK